MTVAGSVAGRRTLAALPPSALDGQRALVRVDFNVPVHDGKVTDATRIEAVLPTIRYLREKGARVVLLSHFGRPKGRADPQFSLAPVAHALEAFLGAPIAFLTDLGDAVQQTKRLPRGSVALLENTRFWSGEEQNDPGLAARFAALGDFFVNDAFGAAHRAHSSTTAIADLLKPAVAGFLMERELRYLGDALANPARPFVAVLGGAKISGKIDVIEALLPKVDMVLIGGAMACTFFKAMGLETGTSLVEDDRLGLAADLLARANEKLAIPTGAVVAQRLAADAEIRTVARDAIPPEWGMFDIDGGTASRYRARIVAARTVLWNGPMGVFETPPFDAGTLAVAAALGDATRAGATTIVGGGDSAAAIRQAGLTEGVSHVSTGGGASLEFLEGKPLPGVTALDPG